ncbi:hypothetical protein BB934_45130 (plasmid) [Microvirga ossetica]|uniref:Uncharacterized protein n=1 Tax=Microvirga ossetica TaxID=1882682 RepID=A0A1B2EZI1_9HYPH|nr:hypothetical protein [Microvirga ossetica]ANY85405.1 hypothetical protein BB934_45130 [Microvirga ossetica]
MFRLAFASILAAATILGTTAVSADTAFYYRFQGRGPEVVESPEAPNALKSAYAVVSLGNGMSFKCLISNAIPKNVVSGWEGPISSGLVGKKFYYQPISLAGGDTVQWFGIYDPSKTSFTDSNGNLDVSGASNSGSFDLNDPSGTIGMSLPIAGCNPSARGTLTLGSYYSLEYGWAAGAGDAADYDGRKAAFIAANDARYTTVTSAQVALEAPF